MTFGAAAALLFLVLDPLGNIPFFVATLQRVERRRHVAVAVRELLVALAVMIAFLFLGAPMVRLLGISEPALGLAGGVVLFLIALRMVFPPAAHPQEELEGEPFVVPLAIPYVAGPSVLATELLLMSREPEAWPVWAGAVLLAWAGTAAILVVATRFGRHLSRRALVATERLMGMVLVAIAIQMFLGGVEAFLGHLRTAGLAG